MILSCPSCGARFRIDAAKLSPGGRSVRCSKCHHTWHAAPPEAEAAADAQAATAQPTGAPSDISQAEDATAGRAPEPDPLPRALRGESEHDAPPADEHEPFGADRRRRALHADRAAEDARRRPSPVGWLVFLMVVAAIVAGLWFGRNELVARVPQAAGLYEMVGIPVNAVAPDLELRDVTRRRTVADGENLLVIEGRIVNTANATREVPQMRVVLFDAAGVELSSWTFGPEAKTLPPRGETFFSTSRADPPQAARELSLTFTKGGS